MLVAALVVAGITAYTQMGVARYPNIDMPSLFIYTRHPGTSPSEIESEISQPLEDAVATVEGVDELRSISFEGASIVILNLDLNRNVDLAAQDARDAIGRDIDELPFGTEPPQIGKRDLDSSPVMTIAISGPRDSRELYVLADRYVKQVIESAEGVGEVTIRGAMDRAVQVRIDARRLTAYGLSIVEVREALARQNTEIPGGLMQTPTREFTLRTMGRVDQARDFNDLVVATIDGHPIRLNDLGEVIDGQKELRNTARLNDVPAVVLFVQRQSGANTVDVIQQVKSRLERSRELLPPDVSVSVLQDQSGYIVAAMHEVQKHLISGSVLASLVVLLFMRSWRSALIAAIAIPTSIIATFAIMRPLGFTLNNVTMLALVLMVGVVIDDAVIVLENVFRYIEEEGLNPFEAAIRGTREIGLAVLATTFSLVIVFLPVSFLDSVTGRLLFQFGITATIAVLISMLISFSLTPMMCSRLLHQQPSDSGVPQSRGGIYRYIESGYLICLRWAMRHRWLVACISVITIAANYPLYHLVQQDYIPSNVDESEFEIRLTADEGTGMQSMDKATVAIENQLKNVDGIEYMLTSVGGRGAVNRSEIFVRLVDISDRSFSVPRLLRETWRGNPSAAWQNNFSQQEKMQEVRDILSQFPDLRGSVRNLTSFRQGPPVDIDFSITGPSLDGLHDYGNRLLEEAKAIPGIVDADLTLKMNKPELLVHINRERAAALGVDVQEIAETLRICVGGDEHVSRYRDNLADDAYDVELRLVGIDRSNTDAISQLYVRTRNNTTQTNAMQPTGSQEMARQQAGIQQAGIQQAGSRHTRLDNVVNFEYGESASRIDRLDHERMVAIRANIAPGFALKDRIEALNDAAERVNLPEGYNTSVRGRGRELERTLNEFGWTFLMSFIFMYIVLAAQFEHFVHPITILISLPLAVPFGLFSLWMGGETLNLYSALGILVLFGVVKKASILQVDHTNQLREQGMPRDTAIILANRDRLRPILMTTFSFVAGMFPLLIGVGPGAEERRSIAVLAVGGQTLSLLLTLLAIPVTYSLLDDLWTGRFKQQSDE